MPFSRRLPLQISMKLISPVNGVLMLGTPWTIVVGSLAYNEMAVTAMLAGGLLLLIVAAWVPLKSRLSPLTLATLLLMWVPPYLAMRQVLVRSATASYPGTAVHDWTPLLPSLLLVVLQLLYHYLCEHF